MRYSFAVAAMIGIFVFVGNDSLGEASNQSEAASKVEAQVKAKTHVQAKPHAKASKKNGTHSSGLEASGPDCAERWRMLKDCRIHSGEMVYQFREDKVLYNNGRGRWVFDFPEGALAKEWHILKLTRLQDQDLIEWYGWMPEAGDGEVGALHWLVMAVRPEGLHVLLNEVVQHRHKDKQDVMIAHALRRQGDKVIWEVGYRHGELDVERHPASH